jgi:hypothetical protein
MRWTLPDVLDLPQAVYVELLAWIREQTRNAQREE